MTQRAAFVSTVSRLLDEDEKLVLLLGDISVFAFREAREKHPARALNMGVTEQASVGFAAGLAMAGFYPLYHTIDSFMVRRAYEFIRIDFAEQKLPGLFVSVGHNRDYAKLGPTHWCDEAVEIMRRVPGLKVYEPYNSKSAGEFIEAAVRERMLAYVRLSERNDA